MPETELSLDPKTFGNNVFSWPLPDGTKREEADPVSFFVKMNRYISTHLPPDTLVFSPEWLDAVRLEFGWPTEEQANRTEGPHVGKLLPASIVIAWYGKLKEEFNEAPTVKKITGQ